MTRKKHIEFGVKSPAEKRVLGRYKNRWAANIVVLNRMRLCGLGDGVKMKVVETVIVVFRDMTPFVLVEMYGLSV